MPTFLVFKSGNKVKELVGANPGALQVSPVRSSLPILDLADSAFADPHLRGGRERIRRGQHERCI